MLPAGALAVTDWSRDGRVMLMRQGELFTSPGDIWAKPVDGEPRALLRTPFAEYHARFSPDTRWVSYVSNESGRDEVYVMPFAMPEAGATAPVAAGDRVRISTAGGVLPRWRRDGRELFYLSPDLQVMAAALDATGTRVDVRSVTPLFSLNPKPVGWVFDVMPDGQRFIVNSLGDEGRRPLALVTNWRATLQPAPCQYANHGTGHEEHGVWDFKSVFSSLVSVPDVRHLEQHRVGALFGDQRVEVFDDQPPADEHRLDLSRDAGVCRPPCVRWPRRGCGAAPAASSEQLPQLLRGA